MAKQAAPNSHPSIETNKKILQKPSEPTLSELWKTVKGLQQPLAVNAESRKRQLKHSRKALCRLYLPLAWPLPGWATGILKMGE